MLKFKSARPVVGTALCLCLGLSISAFASSKGQNYQTPYTQKTCPNLWMCPDPNIANANTRSGISDLERVKDTQEVAKVWAKHAYYHENGFHKAEFDALWVSSSGKYAETTAFANPSGVWYGWDTVYASYVDGKLATLQDNLADLLSYMTDDEVEELLSENNVDSTDGLLGMGGEYCMHMQTTAVIEIAGDGQTAKGIWFSPGLRQQVAVKDDGTFGVSGGWFMEKYGVDFAKENGEWKIWHMQTYYENTPDNWGDSGTGLAGGNSVAQNYENPTAYESYSATKLPSITPAIPVPYYTFDETFSYGAIGDAQ